MAEVFISYSQKDRALVAPIAARLAELGVDAWYDRKILAGQPFDDIINARLKEAKAVLACWSPTSIELKWVRSEAEYARGVLGTYLPIFITPCSLLPPFNLIHTDDLSKWTGEANDSSWIQLVDRIAALVGREGVAAAARALASGDEHALYDFARRYPEEPIALKIWNGAEARYREDFAERMAEAKSVAETRIAGERTALEANLTAAAPAFETWLAEEKRGTAKGPMPDPLGLVEPSDGGERARLCDEIAALQGALALANAKDGDLRAASTEIGRLTEELTTVRSALAQAIARERELDMWGSLLPTKPNFQ